MTISEYSHKNRKYKPLVKDGMVALVEFFHKLEEVIEKDKKWKPQELSSALMDFSNALSPIVNRKGGSEKSTYVKNHLTISPAIFEVDKHVFLTLYNMLKMLKTDINNAYRDGLDNEQPMLHFLFLGEKREIDCEIVRNSNNLSAEHLDKFINGTKVPAVDFEKMSIEAIKKGKDQQELKNGLQVVTQIKFSFIMVPATDSADAFLRSYPDNTIKRLEDEIIVNGKKRLFKHAIPCIFNDNHDTLPQLICSLIVQYYISFGDFKVLKFCELCGALIFVQRQGKIMCSSGICKNKRDTQNDAIKKAKRKCITRQNRWFQSYVPEKFRTIDGFIGKNFENIGVDQRAIMTPL